MPMVCCILTAREIGSGLHHGHIQHHSSGDVACRLVCLLFTSFVHACDQCFPYFIYLPHLAWGVLSAELEC